MRREISIALSGNPNSGKTTIFNNLTGLRQHVGNYPGVTVEKKTGVINYKEYKINVVDLPGTYSLTAYSTEQIVARNFIIDQKPDVVVDIVDSSNLERNLYLAVQLLELKVPLVLVFNMADIARRSGRKIDIELLSELFGAPIVETVGRSGMGNKEVLEAAIDVLNRKKRKKVEIKYGEEIENEIVRIKSVLKREKIPEFKFDTRWAIVKLLEQDNEVIDTIKKASGLKYQKLEKNI
jgi:ferrous iron transport protein B